MCLCRVQGRGILKRKYPFYLYMVSVCVPMLCAGAWHIQTRPSEASPHAAACERDARRGGRRQEEDEEEEEEGLFKDNEVN